MPLDWARGGAQSHDMGERLELLIAERDIRARVNAVARDIDADYRGKRLSLIVVLKGAVIFAADLMREIETPCTFDVVSAASYGAGTRSVGMVTLTGLDGLDIAGRDVLVIDDILDTGRTIAAIIDALQQRGPASLALVALLRKPTANALDLPVAYIGFDIPEEIADVMAELMPALGYPRFGVQGLGRLCRRAV